MADTTHVATLVRGNVYFYGNLRFDHGVSVPVTKEQVEHLKANAVDVFSDQGETFTKSKFEFAVDGENSTEQSKKTATPTKRTRKTTTAD